MKLINSILLFMLGLKIVVAKNILFLLPLASKSHKNVFEPLITEMAKRNHQITVVSPYHPAKKVKGIRELVPTQIAKGLKAFGSDPFKTRRDGKFAMLTQDFNFMFEACVEAYENEEFMNLLNEKWDLIYINAFMNDCMYAFVYKIGAPFIIVSTIAAPNQISSHAGNRLPPSFVPSAMVDFPDSMSFPQRMGNLVFNILVDVISELKYIPKYEAINRKYFGNDLPGLHAMIGNVSAILMNSHLALTYPRPTLPDVIEVGGMHCRPANPLPKDIEEFAAGATQGFIYFSLGSIVQASTMPENVRLIFRNVFSRLNQRVLWKWETGEMADLPENVKLLKWAPQQDILGHKNIKMFITHGGLLSTQEAVYHGVPLIGLPIFSDQDLNMHNAERTGYAITVEILDITEEILESTIQRILNESRFSERARGLSTIFRDQPETPVERAAFWSEYVMRHKGALHMRSAARDLNFFQYHSLDVIGTLALIIISTLWITKVIVSSVIRQICVRGASSAQSKVKRQ